MIDINMEQRRADANARALVIAGEWKDPSVKAAPKPGVLTETVRRCPVTERKIREFSGDKNVWMAPFQGPMLQQASLPIETKDKVHFYYLANGGSEV
ncbi:hypothetical protein [Caballeronia sordidicola]|uniref:Uncharacterized protein n=1 Tax=Caballeronia sordidicola TaxID=196367 RepID=A0A242MSZ4_CABSO|nr:hypothetical protein [Caballeronia sordidicola]OTP74450.1 hypothetical protein PAMC26510_16550 [Caballeronia sordidicola]